MRSFDSRPASLEVSMSSLAAATFQMIGLSVLWFCRLRPLSDAPLRHLPRKAALAILKYRGDHPRQKQNRLIFLAADADSIGRLKDQVCSVLAWQSIVADVKEGRLNLDQHQAKQASNSLDQANDGLGRMLHETYKWLLAPMQEAKPGKGIGDLQWEHFQVNPAVVNRSEEIEKILKEHELLIAEWSPIHLSNLMRSWFWKDDIAAVGAVETWQKTCCYLYLPRLRDADTLRVTISAGINSR
ncbi:hypothetical protein LP420_22515 [Massilia sp. B-10]|nr:hypothetical protein LP420_22515 [Massilia sp. B-10]